MLSIMLLLAQVPMAVADKVKLVRRSTLVTGD